VPAASRYGPERLFPEAPAAGDHGIVRLQCTVGGAVLVEDEIVQRKFIKIGIHASVNPGGHPCRPCGEVLRHGGVNLLAKALNKARLQGGKHIVLRLEIQIKRAFRHIGNLDNFADACRGKALFEEKACAASINSSRRTSGNFVRGFFAWSYSR
jgi:hypothetical protein